VLLGVWVGVLHSYDTPAHTFTLHKLCGRGSFEGPKADVCDCACVDNT